VVAVLVKGEPEWAFSDLQRRLVCCSWADLAV